MPVTGKALLASAAIVLASVLASAGAALAAPPDPSGTYLTEDGRARIRVERCGAQQANICGYVVWMKAPMTDAGALKVDAKNPDPAKSPRALLGHQLMMGLAPYKEESYTGKIYNNEDGKNYDVTIYLKDDTLKVKGCLIAFLCKTQTWTRAGDVLPGQLAGATATTGGPQPDAEWMPAAPGGAASTSKAVVKAKAKP